MTTELKEVKNNMRNKYFKVTAKQDGLWLEINGDRHRACLNLTAHPDSIEGRAAVEVWGKMRLETCSRCGESIDGPDSMDGCRDVDCPVPSKSK